MEMMAIHAAWIINLDPWRKKFVSVAKLLGRPVGDAAPEDMQPDWERLKELEGDEQWQETMTLTPPE
jgi:hypothetical protein